MINLGGMRTENKLKAAAVLKKKIMAGVEDLASGRYRTGDDATVMQLAEEVSLDGRARLNALCLKVAAKRRKKAMQTRRNRDEEE
jgi:hypothetical protein